MSRMVSRRVGLWGGVSVTLLAGLLASARGAAETITPLASYEPSEVNLSVFANPGDPGLSLARIPGGAGGAPPATDGAYVLRVTVAGETDRKVEFRHDWLGPSYDLQGEDALLLDIWIASPGAMPGLIGIWDAGWSPPDAWQPAANLPTGVGVWTTISFNLAGRQQYGLRQLWALVLENLAGSSGVVYVDNLRLRRSGPPSPPAGLAANAYSDRVTLAWQPTPVAGASGYNVYHATSAAGPFVRVNAAPIASASYVDIGSVGGAAHYYRVTAVVNGVETAPSAVVSATYNGLTDDELLDVVQRATLRYFWDFGHPVCGMAREGLGAPYPPDTVTTGGTGMGLMTLVVAAERGFLPRAQVAQRVRTILAFLEDVTPRYHGAWSHHYHGVTGQTIPFSAPEDNGGDLVETAFLVQGMLTARQYFTNANDPVETEIRARATRLWEAVEWTHYRRYPASNVLYWNWSPNYGFAINVPVLGYNEAMIVYLLAIASPTHPMPASSFHNGYAGLSTYANGRTFYGRTIHVGPDYGGPLFFTHYSHLGFDPRYRRDAYANYFENARNASLVHVAHCVDNPGRHAGYSAYAWGLTASADPGASGYDVHSPAHDNGTLAPTAALSALPFAPAESLAAFRQFYDVYRTWLWGSCGFLDAVNLDLGWVAPVYIAIDQGPILPMIENYRSGLCWRLFMSNPEIRPMLLAIGMYDEVDFDTDGDVDIDDVAAFAACFGGPASPCPGGCPAADFADADLDGDADVDLGDAAILQRLFNGAN